MEGLGVTGHSGSALAGSKFVRVDLTLLVTVDLASNKVVDLAWCLAVNLALPVAVDLASLNVGSGELHTAYGGMI